METDTDSTQCKVSQRDNNKMFHIVASLQSEEVSLVIRFHISPIVHAHLTMASVKVNIVHCGDLIKRHSINITTMTRHQRKGQARWPVTLPATSLSSHVHRQIIMAVSRQMNRPIIMAVSRQTNRPIMMALSRHMNRPIMMAVLVEISG